MLTATPSSPVIRFAPGLRDVFMASVGRLEPEHYAILAGYLDDPWRVTDIRPMPPALDDRGRKRASGSAVTLNGPVIEYHLNTELLPFGKYILGAIHSHPGQFTHLSGGLAGSGEGDIPTMRQHLQNAVALKRPWRDFLAPIVTQPGDDPLVTGWIVRLDQDDPIPANVVWESKNTTPVLADSQAAIDQILSIVNPYQSIIEEILGERKSPSEDRAAVTSALRQARERDLNAFARRHELALRDK